MHIIGNKLTYIPLFNLLCHEGEDEKHLNHDFHYNVSHFWRRGDFDIYPQSREEIFDTFKEVDKCASPGANSKNSLSNFAVKICT